MKIGSAVQAIPFHASWTQKLSISAVLHKGITTSRVWAPGNLPIL